MYKPLVIDQPTYHFGHYVLFGGGHSIAFNTATNDWDAKGSVEFPPVAEQENLSEVLFAFQDRLYLLLFVPFGEFKVTEIYRFSSVSRQWELHSAIQTEAKDELAADPEKNFKQELVLVKGDSHEGVYFVSFVDHKIRLHLLRIPSARWEVVAEVASANDPNPIQPTMAALLDSHVYVQGGVHGCGFRWQPQRMLKINVEDHASDWLEVAANDDGHRPAWGFTGSLEQTVQNFDV